jgi:hypothetical protein
MKYRSKEVNKNFDTQISKVHTEVADNSSSSHGAERNRS